MSNHFEIDDVIPREGVFDVEITNENGNFEQFTFDNEKKEDKQYIDEIAKTIDQRNSDQKDKKEFEDDIGKKVDVAERR